MLPHENWKWKVETKLDSLALPHLKLCRSVILPHSLGLGEDGKWIWPWIPFKSVFGLKISPKQESSYFPTQMDVIPFVHLKALNPVFGKLVYPAFEIQGNTKAEIRREFLIGWQAKLVIRASLGTGSNINGMSDRPHWAIKLDLCSSKCGPMEIVKSEISSNGFSFKYSQGFKMTNNSKFVISSTTSNLFSGLTNRKPNFFSFKFTQNIGMMFSKGDPLPTNVYSKALEHFGRRKMITVIPGHYIDPGVEQGAPGEREFNLEIANYAEERLHAMKWKVLRPDKDAPNLSWNEYLNWVSRQTLMGRPVLEIHGQGSTADYRGLVYGIIGDTKPPLNQELAKEFGVFEMDWTGLGVPSHGGIIVESFNTDEVLNLDPPQRIWAARSIANRIVDCVQRVTPTDSMHSFQLDKTKG